jgi:hypothetical protein
MEARSVQLASDYNVYCNIYHNTSAEYPVTRPLR